MILPPPVSTMDIPRNVAETALFKKLTYTFGVLAILTSIAGIIGNIYGITPISSVCPGCKTLALSAAIIWILFGAVLVFVSIKPVSRSALLILRTVLVIIACTEAFEIIVSLTGSHFFVESWFITLGSIAFGPRSSPISPIAAGLIILAAAGLFFCSDPAFLSGQNKRVRQGTVVTGSTVALTAFTLVLSYFYGNPLLYGTPVIPIAAISALAAFFIGAGLIAAAGTATAPVRYFMGNSIRAILLRNFVTLVIVITLGENILFHVISSWYSVSDAVILSVCIVIFTLATASIVGRLSGEISQVLDKAEQALVYKNEELGELNEELIAAEEELRQNMDELTKKEQDLRESEKKYRTIVESANEGIWIVDKNHLTTFVNERMVRMLGFAPEEMIGRSYRDFVDAESAALSDRVVEEKKKGITGSMEYRLRKKDGSSLWTFVNAQPIFDENGNFAGSLSMLSDITAWKETNEALRQSEMVLHRAQDLLDSITKSSGVMIAAEDKEFNYTYFNKAYAEEIKNITGNDLAIGMNMIDIFAHTPDEQKKSVRQWGKVFTGRSVMETIFFDNPGGKRKIYNVIHTPIRDEEGRVIGAGEVSYDVTRQVQTAEELHKTSEYLENLINYANAPIIVWDTEFHITRFNRAFEFLTGLPASMVLGKPLGILFPEKSPIDAMDLIRKTRTGERWESVEIPIRHVSGAAKIVLWNSANIYEKDGVTISSTIAQGQDITERKVAEETAIKTASLLNAALDSTADGILVVDTAGTITSYNKTFCSIWGIPEHALDAAEEKTALAYMTPLIADSREFVTRLNELYSNPERESYDTVSLTDGRIFERYSKPQKIEKTLVGRVWSYRDITERKQAEEALRESLEKFRIIATNTPDHILVQDKELRYTQVINPQLGLTAADMIGHTDNDIMSPEDAHNLTEIKRGVLDSGTAVYMEIPLLSARGERNYFAGSYVPKRNAEGEIDGIIGYFRNVTETKQVNEKIVAALAEKEILIREIHHRVKNNLQIISGLLDMTRMRTNDPATTGILTDMMMKIKTMAQIHTRLYESKQFDKISMGGQIRDQVADLSSIYGNAGPEITCEVDIEEFPLSVDKAIPCALVVNEALSNAFKHAFRGRRHGTIGVSARLEGGTIHICIQDDGIGIPKDVDINHATSLGLKLIRSLVLQLRGTLTIESTSRGSRVNVEFPVGTEG